MVDMGLGQWLLLASEARCQRGLCQDPSVVFPADLVKVIHYFTYYTVKGPELHWLGSY